MRRETLILFARPPIAGRAKTRLVPALGAEGAAALYAAFLADAARTAAAVRAARPTVGLCAEWAIGPGERPGDFPLAAWLPGPFLHCAQAGGDLGDRMAAALGRRLAGGGRAVLVGTDLPDLPPGVLLGAFRALEGGSSPRAAIGPAEDGGYYLIGLNRFDSSLFRGLPWGTDEVYISTIRKFNNLGITVSETLRWADVDDPEGLAGLRARLAAAPDPAAPATRAALARLP